MSKDSVVSEWIDAALAGNTRAVARLITLVESDATAIQSIGRSIYPHTGRAHLVGITGPPGSGKSSLVNELAKAFRQRARRVGIVAVDPSSPFTGGAILGDRVRMSDLAGDEGIFVRSMASRGSLGGLARATSAVVKVLDAAAYDIIFIETVGAGQAEVDVAAAAHTTVVLEAPGMGDDIQSIKAGILEIADILVVNKADQPGANRVVKSLEMMLHLGQTTMRAGDFDTAYHDSTHAVYRSEMVPQPPAGVPSPSGWAVPVLQTVATTGAGVEELAAIIETRYEYLHQTGEWVKREWARSRGEIDRLVRNRFIDLLARTVPAEEREALIAAVVERRIDPDAAAERLFTDAASILNSRVA